MSEFAEYRTTAKTTDARYERYVQETGLTESWELDALEPAVLAQLIETEVTALRSEAVWNRSYRRQEDDRVRLTSIAASM